MTNTNAIKSSLRRMIVCSIGRFNRMLQSDAMARSLIELHLPEEVVRHLNLKTLELCDTGFIDLNLRRKFFDRLFQVELTEEARQMLSNKVTHAYLLILIEHKSQADPLTVIQMLGYIVRIWENSWENRRELAPIIPWVLYNGVKPWQTAKSLSELIPVPESWKRYFPGLELPILDISRMFDSAMGDEPILQVTFTFLKYGRSADLEQMLRPMLRMLSQKLPWPQAENLLKTTRTYVMSVNPVVGKTKINELYAEFWPVQP